MTISPVAKEQLAPAETGTEDATRVVPLSADGTETQAAPTLSSVTIPQIGQEIGPVRLVSQLGRGAMGVVFLGHHKHLGRQVAVKVLTATSPALRSLGSTRFADEAKAAATVQDRNLAQIYHADVSGELPYLVMEYVDGPTLARLLAKVGKLSPKVMISVMLEVSSAVARLHEHDIIHRDLKPSNVLLDATGRAVVSDFGLAVSRPPASSGASDLRLAGTPAYMAPEMFEGRISPRTDIYAMGIMMLQLLTGKVPFEGTIEALREQHLHQAIPLDELHASGIDPAIIEVIERATHKQPIFRYKTAHELHRALRSLSIDPIGARRELENLIESVSSESKPAAPPAASPKIPPFSSYGETIARVAAATRERKRAWIEAASTVDPLLPLPQLAEPSPPLTTPDLPMPAFPPDRPEPQDQPDPQDKPRALTAVAVCGIILAPLAAVSLLFDLYLALLPAHPSIPLPFGWKPLGLAGIAINLLLMALLLAACIAALRRRRWAQPALLAWAFAELICQTVMTLSGIFISVPHLSRRLSATFDGPAGAGDMGRSFAIFMSAPFALRWLLVTVLAIFLIRVLRLPRIKTALNGPSTELP